MRVFQSAGQSVAEYAIVMSLIAIAATGTVIVLGDEITATLTSLLAWNNGTSGSGGSATTATPITNAGTTTTSPSATNTGASTSSAGSGNTISAIGGLASGQLDLGNGLTLSLNNYPVDLAQSVETTGVNGTSQRLLAAMQTMIETLQASGEIEPKQASQLQSLANQGHRIAEIEKILEQAMIDSGGDGTVFNAMKVNFDGQDMTVYDLRRYIGYSHTQNEYMGKTYTPFNHPVPLSENIKFIELYQKAEDSGALDNPLVNMAVKGWSTNILSLTDFVELSASYVADNAFTDVEPEMTAFMANRAATELSDPIADKIHEQTQKDSASICTTGGGSDNSVSCQ